MSDKEQKISEKYPLMIVSIIVRPEVSMIQDMGEQYRDLRVTILEGIMGQTKTYNGMVKAKFRGLVKIEIQFLMTATVLNLKKIVKILHVVDIKSRLSIEITGIIYTGKNIFRKLVIKLAIQES